jgi:hypothetical protein
MAVQELQDQMRGTLRVDGDLDPFVMQAGRLVIADDEGNPAPGPDATDIATAQANAAAALAAAEAAAASAAAIGLPSFDDVATLLDDEQLSYAPGAYGVTPGDFVRTRAEGFSFMVAEADAVDHHDATDGGVKLYRTTQQAVEVTVGLGGDFATINSALRILDGQRRTYGSGATATIRLLTGFVMEEQVLVGGQDLGWITVVSDDAVVSVDETAITEFLGDPKDIIIPLFGATDGGVSPVVGALFEYPSAATAMDGVGVTYGGRLRLLPECGVRKARQAVVAFYAGSHVECTPTGLTRGDGGAGALGVMGADFRDARTIGIYASHGAVVDLPRSNFNNCTCDPDGAAIFGIWGSIVNVYQAQAKNSTGRGILMRDGSRCDARETDVSAAAVHGYQAYHGGYINARYLSTSPAGAGGCSGAGGYGVAADTASTVEADGMNAQNCSTGFRAERGSVINATAANATGCGTAVYAERSAIVSASNLTANNCTGAAIFAGDAATVNVDLSQINSCLNASDSGVVRAGGGSVVQCRDSSIQNGANRVLLATEGGRIVADRANLNSPGGVPVISERGAHISARATTTVGAAGTSYQVSNGGIIAAAGTSGALSQTANAPTADGIIFR